MIDLNSIAWVGLPKYQQVTASSSEEQRSGKRGAGSADGVVVRNGSIFICKRAKRPVAGDQGEGKSKKAKVKKVQSKKEKSKGVAKVFR